MSIWASFIKLSSNVYYLVSYQRKNFGLCKNTKIDICDMLCCHVNNVNIVYLSEEKLAKIGISGHHYNFFINQYIIEFQS